MGQNLKFFRLMMTSCAALVLVGGMAACGGSAAAPCKGGYVLSAVTKTCIQAGDPNFGETRSGEREHTPEEEVAHKKSLETAQRIEREGALAQKKVEEDETRGGEHSIRSVEEKVCYESGKTAEECKGPLKETPQEERSEAENRAQQRQGEEEGGERVPATPGCQTGGCVE
jgi:hypothetical protein